MRVRVCMQQRASERQMAVAVAVAVAARGSGPVGWERLQTHRRWRLPSLLGCVAVGLVSVRVRRCGRGWGRHLASLPMLRPIRLLRLRLRAFGEGDELGARGIEAG